MDASIALERFGLSKNESLIYVALLKSGEASVVKLASHTKVHRRTIYDNLAILKSKGLVSYKLRKGVKYFEASSPSVLQTALNDQSRILNEIMPSLLSLHTQTHDAPRISVHEGIVSAKGILDEALRSKGEVFWFGGGREFIGTLDYSRRFVEQDIRKAGIKLLQVELPQIHEKIALFRKNNVRLLSRKYASKTGYLVYENTVAIGLVHKEEITVLKIESELFAQGFRMNFLALWESGKKLPR